MSAEPVWRALNVLVATLIVVFLIAPMLIVVVISFSSAPFLTFPPPGFSLQWYRKFFDNPAWTSAMATSLLVTIPTCLAATVLGTTAAIALSGARVPGSQVILSFLMAPLVVPVIITGAAIYGLFSLWGLAGTLTGFILAHTILTIPYVISTVLASLATVDSQLERAAMTLGATPWSAFWRVVFPLIVPGILSGLLFALVVSFDDLVVSLFLSSPTVRPVSVQMWSDIRGEVDPTISAVGTMIFGVSLAVLLAETLLRRHGAARPAPI